MKTTLLSCAAALCLALIPLSLRAGEAAAMSVDAPRTCDVFGKAELLVHFAPLIKIALERLPETQIHDAYDADRDGRSVRLSAEFSCDGRTTTVPGFAMREVANGPWTWRVRFSPMRPGRYTVRVHFEAQISRAEAPLVLDANLDEPIVAQDGKREGPLTIPDRADQPPLLRKRTASGNSEPLWLFGACRAWVSETQDPLNDWSPNEWLDRQTELFEPMRANGYNLLNQWMAPWEFLLVHHDRAEFWKDRSGKSRRVALPAEIAWTPYQCFDQGRAAAFDKLIEQCEGSADKSTIYLLLSPLPHQSFECNTHPWGSQESGWSPADDGGKQSLERLNGFSAFKAAGATSPLGAWDFFAADPSTDTNSWRNQLFDHQANFYRYIIARWGYSSALGVWVLADELDAVGDEVGDLKNGKGWWAHPACERWLANVIRLFRGRLERSDGLRYQGDPFAHPLHAAVTSSRGQAERGGNIDWDGGPADAQPDLFGFHWYPAWGRNATWSMVWEYTIAGIGSYSQSPLKNLRGAAHPRLLSEFGAPDRDHPADEPSYLYPSMYHFAIWAGIFSGQAGTPMDWDDGKEFGELTFRKRKGIFDEGRYPIDNAAQLKTLRKFLAPLKPDRLRACNPADGEHVACTTGNGAQVYALFDVADTSVYAWAYTSNDALEIKIQGQHSGNYQLRWFDPWTGAAISQLGTRIITVAKDEPVQLSATEALNVLRQTTDPFPAKSRMARGQDVAFMLTSTLVEK